MSTAYHTAALPVYVSADCLRYAEAGAPSTEPAVYARHWETICHGQEGARFVWVTHLAFRSTGSARGITRRLRPWVVSIHHAGRLRNHRRCASKTLAGALKLTKQVAREW